MIMFPPTQDHPSVAALEDGDFIVTWQDASGQSGGSGNDIWAQRFDASGSAVGDDFRVNTTFTSGHQYTPDVMGLNNGGYVISWRNDQGSSHNDGTGFWK